MRHVSGTWSNRFHRPGRWPMSGLQGRTQRLPCIHVEQAAGGGHEVLVVGLQDGPRVLALGRGPTLEEAKTDLVRQLMSVRRTPREQLVNLLDIRVTCADDSALRREFATH
jgi:hypothetical protein